MAHIAERAGVSTATVSRVLNGSPRVQPVRRLLVLKAIAELGYRPNRLARNFRRQQVEAIGIVVSDIENPHFTSMVRAVEDLAYARGFRVLVCNTDEKSEKQRVYLEMMANERLQGVVISASDPGAAEIGQLIDAGIHVVAFDRPVADPRADVVLANNLDGAERATRLLVQAGHLRIGLVAGPTDIETGRDRLGGYLAAIRAAGLEPHAVDGGFRIEGGRTATNELLDGGWNPTALVVANNLMAIGALDALRARGRRVPEDVALVTIDDAFWSKLVDPPLTTLAQPVRELASAAMQLLFAKIDGDARGSKRVVFDFEMIVRDSCGTAPKGAWRTRS